MKLNTHVDLFRTKKERYPTKHTMNLCIRPDRTTGPATLMLYLLFVLVVLAALFKILFLDPWQTASQLEKQASLLEAQNTAQLSQLSEYDDIQAQYIRMAPTQQEETLVDRMALLDLIDRVIRPEADISQVSISENTVLLTFSGVTLEEAADLVSRLEESPLVGTTSVDTAVSTQEGENLVEVHVYFEVAPEEEPRL